MHKLFYSPGACSLAPHIVLEEIGKPYEVELVQAGAMTQTPEWKAVNPKGRVPALTGVPGRIGGGENLLTEAHAILVYLARSNPEAGLMPTDPAGEARAIEWMNWLASSLHAAAYASVRRPARFVDDPALYPALKAKGTETVRDCCRYVDGLLGDGRDWAVPGAYSVVDPYLITFYFFAARADYLDARTEFPQWTAHARKVFARPAVERIFAKEGLTLEL